MKSEHDTIANAELVLLGLWIASEKFRESGHQFNHPAVVRATEGDFSGVARMLGVTAGTDAEFVKACTKEAEDERLRIEADEVEERERRSRRCLAEHIDDLKAKLLRKDRVSVALANVPDELLKRHGLKV